MPAEIANMVSGEKLVHDLIFPNYVAGIIVHDEIEDTEGVLVVLCDEQDTYTDIFKFSVPDGFVRQPKPNDLLEYCDEDTFCAQVEHGEEHHVEMPTGEGQVLEFVISHSVLMFRN